MCEDDIKLIEEYVSLKMRSSESKRVYGKKGDFKGIRVGRRVFNPFEKAEDWYSIIARPGTKLKITEDEVIIRMWDMNEEGECFSVELREAIEPIDRSGNTTMRELLKKLPLKAAIQMMKKKRD